MMSRRRREKFRPILPRPGGTNNPPLVTSQKEEKIKNDSIKSNEIFKEQFPLNCVDAEVGKVPDPVVSDKNLETESKQPKTDSVVTESKSSISDNTLPSTDQNPSSESTTNLPRMEDNDKPAEKLAVKAPPASRRRRMMAKPSTKRTSKPIPTLPKSPTNNIEKKSDKMLEHPVTNLSESVETIAVPLPAIEEIVCSGTNSNGTCDDSVPVAITMPSFSKTMESINNTKSIENPHTTSENYQVELIDQSSSYIVLEHPVSQDIPPTPVLNSQMSPVKQVGKTKSPMSNAKQARKIKEASDTVRRDHQNRKIAMEKLNLMKQNLVGCNEEEKNKIKWPTLDHNLVSMSDLIYLNPPVGTGKELGIRAKHRKAMEMAENERETPKPPPSPVAPASSLTSTTPADPEPQQSLVPQIRVNEDGSIVIDEESLTIKSPPRPGGAITDGPTLYESGLYNTINQCSFRKRPWAKSSRWLWSEKQTKKFYAALRVVGADFGLMSAMFRKRSRDDLRRKFLLESRNNLTQVDEALSQQHLSNWTDEMFMPESSSEDEMEKARKRKKKKSTSKSDKIPKPQSGKNLTQVIIPVPSVVL